MRITSKGQVTIPQAIREKCGLLPNTEVEFEIKDKKVVMFPASRKMGLTRGQLNVKRMAGRGNANLDLSTDEILAMTRGYPDRKPRKK